MKARTLRKITNTVVCIGAATTILISPYFHKEAVNYTEADKTNNAIYLEEIRTIEEDYNVNFKNEEVYNAIKESIGTDITIANLREITSLSLSNLTNFDLSDLKYLINLESLTIDGFPLDCNYLKYNHNLKTLNILNSNASNLTEIPNSVTKFHYINGNVADGKLFVPYNTTDLRINGVIFSSLTLKNPKNLTIFNYDSFSILDLNEIKDCENLLTCNISYSPNIRNANVLATLPNLKILYLDDYASIWLDKYTLNDLTCIDETTKATLLSQIKTLDKIANAIVPFEMPDEEKVRGITLNVASRIEYDYTVQNQEEIADQVSSEYNKYPITYALDGNGVCINYACLFTALANRVGLENYQDISPKHTWNMAEIDGEYRAFDITNIDGEYAILRDNNNQPYKNENQTYQYYFNIHDEDQLYYYNFNPDTVIGTDHKGELVELTEVGEYNIGYVKNNIPTSTNERIEIYLNTMRKLMPLVPPMVLLNIILLVIEKRQTKRKVLQK